MRTSCWLTIIALLSLLPACDFGSDDEEPNASQSVSETELTTAASEIAAAAILSGHAGAVRFVAWSPDGALLATAIDGFSGSDITPRLWDIDGTLVAELADQVVAPTGLSWSPNSNLLAVGGADGMVRLWNRDGTPSSTMAVSNDDPPAPVAALAWSPDGTLLATACLQLRDPATPGPSNTLPATIQLWQPDGSEARSFEVAHTFRGIVHLAWSTDGSRLAAGGNDLHVWDTSGTDLLRIPGGEYDVLSAVGFSPDGKLLAHVDMTGRLHVSPVDDGVALSSTGFSGAVSLVFSPDSSRLAVVTDRLLLVVPSDNPLTSPVQVVTNGVQGNPVWSPDSQWLATGVARRAVHLADSEGNSLANLSGCDGPVSALAWSPDGALLAAGNDDGRVCLWNVATP